MSCVYKGVMKARSNPFYCPLKQYLSFVICCLSWKLSKLKDKTSRARDFSVSNRDDL